MNIYGAFARCVRCMVDQIPEPGEAFLALETNTWYRRIPTDAANTREGILTFECSPPDEETTKLELDRSGWKSLFREQRLIDYSLYEQQYLHDESIRDCPWTRQ